MVASVSGIPFEKFSRGNKEGFTIKCSDPVGNMQCELACSNNDQDG
jgi:hypothetical protein